MSLYNKYRPKSFDDVIGNGDSVDILRNEVRKEKPSHAYLFHGPTGCGKTTLARIMAKELGANGNDFREVDSADFTGVDAIRDIRRNSLYKALEGRSRVYLLDECHQLTSSAQNALLKALEDAPPNVYYMLCTTDPQKLLSTIRGRCMSIPVTTLNEQEMKKLLFRVTRAENDNVEASVFKKIYDASSGHPRNALNFLDRILSSPPEKRENVVLRLEEKEAQVIDLCRALLNKSPWSLVATMLKDLKDEDPEQLRRAVLGYCSAVLLNSDNNNRAAYIMDVFKDSFFTSGFPGLVFRCYDVLTD